MLTFTFNRGTRFAIDGQIHTIIWILPDDRLQVEKEDKSVVLMDRAQLLALYSELRLEFLPESQESAEVNKKVFKRALSTFSTEVSAAAIRRKRYVDLLGQHGNFVSSPQILKEMIADCASTLGDNKPPSSITVYRWWKKFNGCGKDYRALIDRFSARGGCGSRFKPAVLSVVKDSVNAVYLTNQRESVEDLYTEIQARINKENVWLEDREKLRCPSKSAVYRYVRGLDQYEVAVARFGKQVADLKFRSSMQGPKTTRILERVEIDHTPLDLFVIDLVMGLPLGRPTVTLVLDKYSRMVLGFHIGFQGTSLESVFHALRHAILPKAYIFEKYPEVKNEWPAFGLFEKLVCDNGAEFHAHDLERVALELGFQIEFCPKRKPYYKGSIERYIKTLNFKLAHWLPGTSFARWFHREDYDPEKQAVIDMEALQKIVHIWIIDIYHQSIHRGANGIPQQRWIESAKVHPPRLLADPHRLDIALGRTVQRVVSHKGVELHGGGIFYNSDYLLALRCEHKGQLFVEVTYYDQDIGAVYVTDPKKREHVKVPAVDQEYARGLSLQQHTLIKRHLREINNQQVNVPALAEAKSLIRQIIAELSVSKSARRRQKAAKLRGIGRGATDYLSDRAIETNTPASSTSITKHHKTKSTDVSADRRRSEPRVPQPFNAIPNVGPDVGPTFTAINFRPNNF